jgi:hypothetical protein
MIAAAAHHHSTGLPSATTACEQLAAPHASCAACPVRPDTSVG